ncbi:MAG: hypothetical protein ABEI53_00430 [Candidatus Magasanikbacteria bacterium]
MKAIFRKYYRKVKSLLTSKKHLFIAGAVLMTTLLAWFVVSNFLFLIDNLNTTFNPNINVEVQSTKFDIKSFKKLDLIKD